MQVNPNPMNVRFFSEITATQNIVTIIHCTQILNEL